VLHICADFTFSTNPFRALAKRGNDVSYLEGNQKTCF
jgi:hypothetical protein